MCKGFNTGGYVHETLPRSEHLNGLGPIEDDTIKLNYTRTDNIQVQIPHTYVNVCIGLTLQDLVNSKQQVMLKTIHTMEDNQVLIYIFSSVMSIPAIAALVNVLRAPVIIALNATREKSALRPGETWARTPI